jgi:hypothetical protein
VAADESTLAKINIECMGSGAVGCSDWLGVSAATIGAVIQQPNQALDRVVSLHPRSKAKK